MREHEYKGWDGEKMFPPEDLTTAPSARKWLGHIDCQLLQYTGQKDRNDQKIYEDDICKIHLFTQELGENMGIVEGETEFVSKISISPIGGIIVKDDMPLCFYSGFHEESLEVIGNIYENPELLK